MEFKREMVKMRVELELGRHRYFGKQGLKSLKVHPEQKVTPAAIIYSVVEHRAVRWLPNQIQTPIKYCT